MGLFSKKKQQCSCGGNCNPEAVKSSQENNDTGASVKILGSGCAKCNELEKNTIEALTQLGMDTKIDHITDFTKIAEYGVMSTPALVVDGKVASFGKVLKTDEVINLLKKIRG